MRVSPRLIGVAVVALMGAGAALPKGVWRTLQPGVEYATFSPPGGSSGLFHVIRVTPSVANVECLTASTHDRERRTAADWCRNAGLAVAINAGMFASDGLSNVGYLRIGDHENNRRWNDYRAVLCVGPRQSSLPMARWVDQASLTVPSVAKDYALVLQNLRLIRAPGVNVWERSHRKWSEAAVAMDGGGRLLFVFLRAPYAMIDFNRLLLSLPLDVRQAMHVEGGPEASLSIHGGGVDLDLCGSYETGFLEEDTNRQQWPIPNVLGVRVVPAAGSE